MTVYKTSEYKRKKSREYYHKNKEKEALRLKNWRTKNKDYVNEQQRNTKRERKLKAIEHFGGKCYDCKQTFHSAVYEFHHINPKEKDRDPSKLFLLRWERIIKELEKCVLLCANCHRIRHHIYEAAANGK